MGTMWVDATEGLTGELLLGALVDAGAATTVMQAAVDGVAPGTVRVVGRPARRGDVSATTVDLQALAVDQPALSWSDLRRAVEDADVDHRVRARALGSLERLAAAVGGPPGDAVLPGAGAPEDVACLVAVCAALVDLGVEHVVLSPVAVGPVGSASGPTTLRLLEGWDVVPGGAGTTSAGVALVTTAADRPGPLPAMRVRGSGVGAGEHDRTLQVLLGDEADPERPGTPGAVVLEANVDDLDPRLWPDVVAALLAAGASDAWLTPVLMKKGRPAHTVHVLCPSHLVATVGDVLWRHTTTLGWRETPVTKHVLDRTWVEVTTPAGPVRVKLGLRDGTVVQAMPEYEDVRRAAHQAGMPVREVLAEAHAAAHRAGLRVGAPVP
ncbi:LarC family nickel insertion protein [Actinotalea sp. Marseille-Q4924]|uniref:LarC family nickel insertion protein n=1 Tax=Actinotalea sp. Marseille-Q4924 TaxID=2866571 RepID=UPI001CE46A02|nr:LarC family nickel insertion protein [Actinotalea sp. Marseille-Q4924]